jgi:hypothetical protein
MNKIVNNIPSNSTSQQKCTSKSKQGLSKLSTDKLETIKEKHQRIAQEFLNWCLNLRSSFKDSDKSFYRDLNDFCSDNKISIRTLHNLCADEDLKSYFDEGKKFLATHLYAGSAENKLNAGQINRMIWQFDDFYEKNDSYILSIEIKKIEARANALQKQLEDVQYEYHSLLKKINDKENTDAGQVPPKTLSNPDTGSSSEI